MTKSNNKSRGLLSQTFSLAKKMGETGLDLLQQSTPQSATKLNTFDQSTVIEVPLEQKASKEKKYDNPKQMMREHVPHMSRQLLGRHYSRVNNVASFISPSFNDKVSDYFFDKLNDFVSTTSSVDALLKEVGMREIEELRTDVARSERISQALSNQNKVIALVQGSVTGISGVIGAAIDIPTSLALALRTVYQTGRAHGFSLENNEEQDVVQYIFKQIDFGSVAEKQALLVGVRTISNVLQTHNVEQLQQFLGSDSSTEPLKKWLSNEDGTFKWTWVDKLPQMGFLNKLTPLAGAGISAVYSWKLVTDANDKATNVFAQARRYLILHPDEQLTALVAYEKSEQLLANASPILLAETLGKQQDLTPIVQVNEPNQVVVDVQVMIKTEAEENLNHTEKTLDDLTTQYVEPIIEDDVLDDQETVSSSASANQKVEAEKAEKEVIEEITEQQADLSQKDEKEEIFVEKNQVIDDVKVITKQEVEQQPVIKAEKTLDALVEKYVEPSTEDMTTSTDQQELVVKQPSTDLVQTTASNDTAATETEGSVVAEINDDSVVPTEKKQPQLKRSKKSS